MNRSEELCKLLGIIPRTDVTQIGESLGFCNTTIKKVYPDLTKPSNFVKLLELYCKDFFLADIEQFYPEHKGKTIPEIFIHTIFKFKNIGEDFENLQQQAQVTKWDY